MAWNEPGGDDKRPNDPWGSGNKNQGPPDLDELLNNLFKRLNNLFGGGSRGKGGGIDKGMVFIILIVAFVLYGLWGFTKVVEGERGVLQQFGAYKATKGPGPTFVFKPFQSMSIINVSSINKIDNARERQSNREMLTEDENIIIVKYEVQFKIDSAEDYIFNVNGPVDTLSQASESAVREIVGRNTLEFITTGGRSSVALQAKARVQEIINEYHLGISVQSVSLTEAQFPTEVQSAIDDVTKAREDHERYVNESEAYRNQIVPEARGQAAKLIAEGEGYRVQVVKRAEGDTSRFTQLYREYKKAPRVTRDRMYIDAVEEVLTTTSKVVVDTKGGNSMIYLPLDKMINQKSTINNTMLVPSEGAARGVEPSSQNYRGRVRGAR